MCSVAPFFTHTAPPFFVPSPDRVPEYQRPASITISPANVEITSLLICSVPAPFFTMVPVVPMAVLSSSTAVVSSRVPLATVIV